ncbi:MAG: uroporphyrinogen decarboxylase family protein [Chloroflexota bacterium]
MNKRDRLEKTIGGEATDRVPISLWQHWAGDDQRSADLARSHVDFMMQYDWDFLTIIPSHHYMVIDYGVQDQWQGDASGRRTLIKTPVQRTLHWTDLRPLDPNRGQFGKQIQCLQLIRGALPDTPIIQLVQSPLTQALLLGGNDLLLRSMRTQPDRLRTGLNSLTETTLRYIEALQRNTNIDGILYQVTLASYTELSEAEYQIFGLPYDSKILDGLGRDWWFNVAQINGKTPMLHLFANQAVQVLNWSDREARPSLSRVQLNFNGAYCGGLGEATHLHLGTPTTIREAAREAINIMGRRRLILGAGNTIPATSPRSNLQAARDIVDVSLQ